LCACAAAAVCTVAALPAGAQPASLGRAVVHERTGKALEVVIDGVASGAAPWEGPLEAGPHVVFGRSATLTTAKRSFVVTAGASTDVELVAIPRASGPPSRPPPAAPTPAAEAPSPRAPEPPGKPAGVGPYGGVLLQLLFEPDGTHSDVCSAPFVTGCSVGAPIGGGILGYVGYEAGLVGVDALIGFQGDGAGIRAKVQTTHVGGSVPSLGFLAALRARIAWHGPSIGVRLAPGFGFAYRDIGSIGSNVKSVSYVAPAVTLEGALDFRIGGSVMLSFGLMFWGENAGDDVKIQVPPLTVPIHPVRSTQAFVLPTIGLEFGP
jgi:hypothetical protein